MNSPRFLILQLLMTTVVACGSTSTSTQVPAAPIVQKSSSEQSPQIAQAPIQTNALSTKTLIDTKPLTPQPIQITLP
ncbi:MAG: sorbosone dehydrogenase family protein, partial [Moorea sp. SIO3H5]|nr:sorbosone dehydrogenase family protein [Moorena sp. SIO3H5]